MAYIIPGVDPIVGDALKEVAHKAHMPVPKAYTALFAPTHLVGATVDPEDNDCILVAAGAEWDFGERQLKGILAHEMGHILMQHPRIRNTDDTAAMHQEEFACDEFAARLGYGQELIDALSTKIGGEHDGDTDSHPSVTSRIERLRATMSTLQKAA